MQDLLHHVVLKDLLLLLQLVTTAVLEVGQCASACKWWASIEAYLSLLCFIFNLPSEKRCTFVTLVTWAVELWALERNVCNVEFMTGARTHKLTDYFYPHIGV